MDVDKAIQEANERERREWASVRRGFKLLRIAWILYVLWLLIGAGWNAIFC